MKVLKKIFPQLLFVFFLFLGIFLRFYRLGEVPVSLYWDEAAIGIDAYSLNETGRDMNNMSFWQPVFGSYGDFKAPVLIWLATLSVHFFGLSEWSVRLPVAVFSV
jgi:4-amino-4-deoxy-L-arabinose transferase-like glycosyltransferase